MRKAFAADFGAGNTCLYWINPDAAVPVCTALNDPGGEPSGYAIRQNGKILLGLGLYGLHYEDLKNIQEFHINIKKVPSEKNRQELTAYFKMWREKIMKDNPQEFSGLDESYWFMGCPTGAEWKSKDVRELYKKIFEDAGFKNVYIVPESNGALAYFEKTNKVLAECGSDKKLFLIDLGAYSIDATPYFGGSLGTSYGKYLGASLIERMILRTILYGEEEKFRKGKKIINMPETLKAARALYENPNTHEKFSSYMLLQARKLKEDYFKNESKNILPHGDYTFNSGFYVGEEDDEEELILFTNPDMINILMEKTSIREVLGDEFKTLPKEVIDYAGNLTWMDTLRKFLGELGKKYKVADKGADAVIMLTGGGSLMKCVADEVKKFFSKARVHYDPKAISAIGQGIGLWAPDKIKAILFEKRYNEHFIEQDGENVIIPKLGDAFVQCVVEMKNDIIREEANAVVFGIEQWKTYKCHSTYIPDKIESHFKNWCENTGVSTFAANLERRINELKVTLNEDFKNNVLRPLNMLKGNEEDTLLTTGNQTFLSASKGLLEVVFNFLTQQVVNHYKENEIWRKVFSNPDDGWFSDPRQEWLNENADDLSQWLDKETDGTNDLCNHIFVEEKLPLGDNDLTLMDWFMVEGWTDLDNLMRERKKAILGRLVLEELLDDE